MLKKKAINPIVATSLLLVVCVVAIVSFQSWFNTYSSTLYSDIETKNNCYITTEGLIGSELYLKTNCEQVISMLKIQDNNGINVCNLKDINNLVGYWNFNNDGNDYSTNNNAVTMGNDNEFINYTGGKFNGAIQFDGTDDYAYVDHDDAYLINNGTISFWFYANSIGDHGLISKDSSGHDTGGHISVYTTWGNEIEARIQSTTNQYSIISPASSFDIGKWYLVTITFGSEGFNLYLNNTLIDTDPYTGGLGTNSGGIGNYEPIAIGAAASLSGDLVTTPISLPFDGLIDDLRIYNKILNVDEINTLYSEKDSFPNLIIGINTIDVSNCSLNNGQIYNLFAYSDMAKIDSKLIKR